MNDHFNLVAVCLLLIMASWIAGILAAAIFVIIRFS